LETIKSKGKIKNMTDITALTTKNWQHARGEIGGVVTGIEDIKQCIYTICTVNKGDVPFMPELGTEIIDAIGENSGSAIDIIRAVWLKEIPLQEPRCEITDVTGTFDDNGRIKMTIYFKEKLTGLTDKQEVYVKNAGH